MRAKHSRPPRIRVPNNERALFVVNEQKYIGVVQRLARRDGDEVGAGSDSTFGPALEAHGDQCLAEHSADHT